MTAASLGAAVTGEASWNARTWPVSLAMLLLMASFILVKTARDALFFTRGGIESLPQAYLGIAVLALPVAMAALALVRAVGASRGRLLLPVLACAALLLLAPSGANGPAGTRATVFFVFVPLVYGVLFSITWLLGGKLLEGSLYEVQVEAFRWIGAATILGGALGGLAARALASRLEPAGLLVAGCATLLASAAVVAWTERRYPQEPGPAPAVPSGAASAAPPGPRSSWTGPAALAGAASDLRRVGGSPYVRRLVAIAMVAAVTGVLVEFLFYLLAGLSPRTASGNAKFFAMAYLIMNSGAFVLQVVFYPPLQRRIGVTGVLMALPLALFGGSAALLAGAGMLVGQGLKIVEGGVKQSVHRSSWEQAFLPVVPRDRWLAKLLVDGGGARLAEGATAAALMAWMRLGPARAPGMADAAPVGAAVVGASLLWLVLAGRMRRELVRHAREFPADRCRPDSPLPDG